uniref:Uncharacterized protein n=1 Tax=Panagrolaimus sp. JU765 TaxID=591449 RepID=A0AC34QHT3_9BILA
MPENPTTIMWTLYFLAHHYDYMNEHIKAEDFIEKAIAHTPTVVELFLCQARIKKHRGDIIGATELMKHAHELDTADRYVNCKLVKYQMRCGSYETAIDYAGRFTKETTDPLTSLVDMQTLWIEIELAYSFLKRGKLGQALKVCHEIDNQFSNFYDDQYDFHSYCMRKATICGYADLIKNSDVIRNHKIFIRAAVLATKIYLQLQDVKEGKIPSPIEPKKKVDDKKKPNNVYKKVEEKKDDLFKFKIDDETCESFIKVENPLKNASEFMNQLLHLDVNDMDYYLENPLKNASEFMIQLLHLDVNDMDYYRYAFELYQRMDKFLVMTKLIAKAYRKFPSHPDFQKIWNDYVNYLESHPQTDIAKEASEVLFEKITAGQTKVEAQNLAIKV